MGLSWSTMADTVVLVTAVARKEVKPGQAFFPLTCNYQEKISIRPARFRAGSSSVKDVRPKRKR